LPDDDVVVVKRQLAGFPSQQWVQYVRSWQRLVFGSLCQALPGRVVVQWLRLREPQWPVQARLRPLRRTRHPVEDLVGKLLAEIRRDEA